MRGRLGLVFLLCVGAAAVVQATAVVVFRTETRIVLAADSRMTTRDAHGKERMSTVCKVRPAGRWWTTLGGYMGSSEATSVHPLVVRVLAKTRTMAEVEQALRTEVFPRMREDLRKASTGPAFDLFQPGLLSQIIVAGTNPNDPTLRAGLFWTTLVRRSPFELSTYWNECPSPRCGDGNLFVGASNDGPVRTLIKRPRPAWVERADTDAARRLITMQIATPHSQAGPPIDIVEITSTGARWVQPDPASLCGK